MSGFTYLSLGAGVQSSALLILSAKGLYNCPKADIAVFADTGDEPQWVYDYLVVLQEFGTASESSPRPVSRRRRSRAASTARITRTPIGATCRRTTRTSSPERSSSTTPFET